MIGIARTLFRVDVMIFGGDRSGNAGDELGYARKDIVVDDRLYASSANGLLAVIHALDQKLDRVMLFGHNPEFTDLAHRLAGPRANQLGPTCIK